MAKLKGNVLFSPEKGKQPNESLNLQTRKILEVFKLLRLSHMKGV